MVRVNPLTAAPPVWGDELPEKVYCRFPGSACEHEPWAFEGTAGECRDAVRSHRLTAHGYEDPPLRPSRPLSSKAGGGRGPSAVWSQEAVLRAFRAYHSRHGHLPKTAACGKEGIPAYGTIRKLFGGFKEALREAEESLPAPSSAVEKPEDLAGAGVPTPPAGGGAQAQGEPGVPGRPELPPADLRELVQCVRSVQEALLEIQAALGLLTARLTLYDPAVHSTEEVRVKDLFETGNPPDDGGDGGGEGGDEPTQPTE
jgi:hypothetical protein